MAFVKVGDSAFGGDFEVIPVNTKLEAAVFDIDRVKVKSGENAGKDQLEVTFKITEEGSKYKGREIRYNYLPLYDTKGSWSLVQFAEAVGWPTDKVQGVDVPEGDGIKDVLGEKLILKVGQRPGQDGNQYNRAAGYAKLGTASTTPPKGEEKATKWGDL